jgi:hypothetical protein
MTLRRKAFLNLIHLAGQETVNGNAHSADFMTVFLNNRLVYPAPPAVFYSSDVIITHAHGFRIPEQTKRDKYGQLGMKRKYACLFLSLFLY